jgi:AraC family transcriptional regulator, transcriptional activator FtrA
VPQREATAIAPLLDRLRADLRSRWSVARMAAECRMSARTFLRRFAEATGSSPGDWLTEQRVFWAQQLLREGRLSMDDVAAACGFGSAHTLRHHFRRQLGISPTEYRSRFMPERASA